MRYINHTKESRLDNSSSSTYLSTELIKWISLVSKLSDFISSNIWESGDETIYFIHFLMHNSKLTVINIANATVAMEVSSG